MELSTIKFYATQLESKEEMDFRSKPDSIGIAGATIPSNWLILTVLSTLCRLPHLLSIRLPVRSL